MRLLPTPTEDEQSLAGEEENGALKKEVQLAEDRPDRIKGRQAYFAARARHVGGKRRCDPRMPTTRAIAQVHVGLWNEKGASERGAWEKAANHMAICRKKNMRDALDEVQDETLGLRKRITERVADRKQTSMAEETGHAGPRWWPRGGSLSRTLLSWLTVAAMVCRCGSSCCPGSILLEVVPHG